MAGTGGLLEIPARKKWLARQPGRDCICNFYRGGCTNTGSQRCNEKSSCPAPDDTYTVGIGTTQNGTITVVNGIITGIQETSNGNPNAAVLVGSGFEDAPCNGNWYPLGNNGKNTYRNEASNRVCSADIQTGRWYIGAAEWPNQGNQSYFLNTTDDPPLGANWGSAFWLFPGTTAAV